MLPSRSSLLLSLAFVLSVPAFAAERVGEAILINTSVTGNGGTLATSSPVHRDERIRASSTGLGEFVFGDGTRLAVGAGSSVVIDKFVFNDDQTAKALSIKAAKGSFRWISGNSKSSAYTIKTPVGTMGVRGTAFDFYVGSDGTPSAKVCRNYLFFLNYDFDFISLHIPTHTRFICWVGQAARPVGRSVKLVAPKQKARCLDLTDKATEQNSTLQQASFLGCQVAYFCSAARTHPYLQL